MTNASVKPALTRIEKKLEELEQKMNDTHLCELKKTEEDSEEEESTKLQNEESKDQEDEK